MNSQIFLIISSATLGVLLGTINVYWKQIRFYFMFVFFLASMIFYAKLVSEEEILILQTTDKGQNSEVKE